MVFIEKNEDPNVDIEILDGDKSQVGLGFEANDHIANLENKYEWFANGVDCYRAAVAVALARGKELNDLDLLEFIHATLGVSDVVLETLTGVQASTVIDRLK
jgi:hypothetical protein